MAMAEPIRDKKELKKIVEYYLKMGQLRNYVLVVMGVHTALRISDLLSLTWNDVYDSEQDKFCSHITLTERKTGKEKTLALNKAVITALKLYLPYKRGDFIFANNRKDAAAISRIQAYRVIKSASEAIRTTARISCHSLRKTFGYHAWRKGVAAVLLMDIFNHTSYDVTRRYLGISQDDRDKVYLEMALF